MNETSEAGPKGPFKQATKRSPEDARARRLLHAIVVQRITAKFIDLFLVIAVSALLPYPIGPMLGFAYSLLADGFRIGKLQSQSLGKKIFRLKIVRLTDQRPAGFLDSVYRNAPVGVATFFALIPIWGWLILVLVGLPLMLIEIYLMIKAPNGHRLGDVMADTEVRRTPPRQT